MNTLLNFSFKNPGSSRLVEVGDFQNMGRIDPVVGAPSHDMIASDIEFVDRDLCLVSACGGRVKVECRTLL